MVLVNLPVCCKEMDMWLLVEFPAALDVSSVQLIGMSCRSRLWERGMWVQAVVMMLFWFLWYVSFFLQKNKATKHRPFGGTKMSPNFETPPSFMDYFCIFAIGMLSLLATVTHWREGSQRDPLRKSWKGASQIISTWLNHHAPHAQAAGPHGNLRAAPPNAIKRLIINHHCPLNRATNFFRVEALGWRQPQTTNADQISDSRPVASSRAPRWTWTQTILANIWVVFHRQFGTILCVSMYMYSNWIMICKHLGEQSTKLQSAWFESITWNFGRCAFWTRNP